MNTPHPTRDVFATKTDQIPAHSTLAIRSERQPWRSVPHTRKYEIDYLGDNNGIVNASIIAPAIGRFEEAFCAMAHGTLVSTVDGPVAIEDILPGTRVETVFNGPQPVQWVGSMNLIPNVQGRAPELGRLSRITADRFGMARPATDLMLAPHARIFYKNALCQNLFGTDAGLASVSGFCDGDTVFEVTPATPVRVYQLAFARHEIIRANGVEIESYHPGLHQARDMDPQLRDLFLTLFPHISSFSDFGPLTIPRFTQDDMRHLNAA